MRFNEPPTLEATCLFSISKSSTNRKHPPTLLETCAFTLVKFRLSMISLPRILQTYIQLVHRKAVIHQLFKATFFTTPYSAAWVTECCKLNNLLYDNDSVDLYLQLSRYSSRFIRLTSDFHSSTCSECQYHYPSRMTHFIFPHAFYKICKDSKNESISYESYFALKL